VDAETGNIAGAVLTATVDSPLNASITYYMSNNGGVKWFIVQPGATIIFPTTGTDLRWRVELHSLLPTLTP